uniref:Uncharacterized protein n=1 Tax=Nelumbo nucifera TaxID=4432 RepID=A0A822ZG92_NELNU|nr:TPA_asm: hypothetical protein HUJ06_000296 [Nelumbo nucifera]
MQALPNQQTVDYPSFKLVIVGDGGTGILFSIKFHLISFYCIIFTYSRRFSCSYLG